MPIEWTQDLATGIEEIDEQHRELYRQIAALHAAMKEHALERVPGILAFLERYAREHFATEQTAMEVTRYPDAAGHLEAHRRFVEDLHRHLARATPGGITTSLVVELSAWLGEWLRDHVRRVDGALARHLRSATAPAVPRPRR